MACGWQSPLLHSLVLLLCLSSAVNAAMITSSGTWAITYADLKPNIAVKYRHRFYYQVPEKPKGAVLLFHGCVHSGYNYFPRSTICNECRGLPEEMSHTLQALNRGYAVVAISSVDRATGCWSWNNDSEDVKQLVRDWQREQGLRDLPLYGMGISSGASFLLKMPRWLNFSGVVSEALGVNSDDWGYKKVDEGYPATLFVAMMKDESTVSKIMEDRQMLRDLRRPEAMVRVYPRLVYPSYFSDRDPHYITKTLSVKITKALRKIGMLDSEGAVILNPRYTTKPWLNMLKAQVPELKGPVTTFKAQYVPKWNDTDSTDTTIAAVYSLMNLAYAYHEIISDYATVALVWFESGGKADIQDLLKSYTYGLPPPQYRQEVTEVAEDPMGKLMRQERSALEIDTWAVSSTLQPDQQHQPEQQQQRNNRGKEHEVEAAVAADRAEGAEEAAEEERTALSEEVEDSLDLSKAVPLPVLLPAHLFSDANAGARSRKRAPRMGATTHQPAEHQAEGSGSTSYLGTLIGGMVCGAGMMTILAGAVWAVVQHHRATVQQAIVLGAATMQAVHHPAPSYLHSQGYSARLSIVPGVTERFEYEVMEQTGSPFSARRRVKTAFHESPRKLGSPHKNSGE